MATTEKDLLAITTIDFPVRYEEAEQSIRDAKGMMVCDVRGWSKIQFMTKAQERHNAIGTLICDLLNDYRNKQVTDFDEMMLGV